LMTVSLAEGHSLRSYEPVPIPCFAINTNHLNRLSTRYSLVPVYR
jgi:hypothetical protein